MALVAVWQQKHALSRCRVKGGPTCNTLIHDSASTVSQAGECWLVSRTYWPANTPWPSNFRSRMPSPASFTWNFNEAVIGLAGWQSCSTEDTERRTSAGPHTGHRHRRQPVSGQILGRLSVFVGDWTRGSDQERRVERETLLCKAKKAAATPLQSQKAATAYFSSKQLLPFSFTWHLRGDWGLLARPVVCLLSLYPSMACRNPRGPVLTRSPTVNWWRVPRPQLTGITLWLHRDHPHYRDLRLLPVFTIKRKKSL